MVNTALQCSMTCSKNSSSRIFMSKKWVTAFFWLTWCYAMGKWRGPNFLHLYPSMGAISIQLALELIILLAPLMMNQSLWSSCCFRGFWWRQIHLWHFQADQKWIRPISGVGVTSTGSKQGPINRICHNIKPGHVILYLFFRVFKYRNLNESVVFVTG